MEAKVIDWARVDELRDEVGAEDFEDVVEIFLIEMDEIMDRLRAQPDAAVGAADLHFLKGSALNLGFQSLGEQCAEGERRSRAGTPIAAKELVAVYDRARAEFLARSRSGPAAA